MSDGVLVSGFPRWNVSVLEKERIHWEKNVREHPLEELVIETTTACNLFCRHCGSSCVSSGKFADPALILEVLCDIHDNIAPFQGSMPRVSFSGGEPLLHPDIVDLISRAHEMGFSTGLVSNGTLVNADLAASFSGILDYATISIDGIGEIHDKLRRRSGSYELAKKGIRELVAANVSVSIATVVGSFNDSLLPEMLNVMKDLPIKTWRLGMVDPFGRALDNPDILPRADTFSKLISFVEFARLRDDLPINVAISCAHYVADHEGLVREWIYTCDSGIRFAAMLVDGSVTGCLDVRDPELVQGKVGKTLFSDIWETRFQDFRQDRANIPDCGCIGCQHARFCRGGSMHTWDRNKILQKVCIGYK